MKRFLSLLFAILSAIQIVAYADFGYDEYMSLKNDLSTCTDVMVMMVLSAVNEEIDNRDIIKKNPSYPSDLSSLSYDDLVALKDRINLAMWQCDEWQEVTVPQGVWKVGEDIPAGTWTVKCADVGRTSYLMKCCELEWGEYLSDSGQSIQWKGRHDSVSIYNPSNEDYNGQITEYTFTVKDGDYIIIDTLYNKAVFTPFAGKSGLGFK